MCKLRKTQEINVWGDSCLAAEIVPNISGWDCRKRVNYNWRKVNFNWKRLRKFFSAKQFVLKNFYRILKIWIFGEHYLKQLIDGAVFSDQLDIWTAPYGPIVLFSNLRCFALLVLWTWFPKQLSKIKKIKRWDIERQSNNLLSRSEKCSANENRRVKVRWTVKIVRNEI